MAKICYRNHVIHLPDDCEEKSLDALKVFIDYFLDFRTRLGLLDWYIEFSLLTADESLDHHTYVSWHYNGRCATCCVSAELLSNYPEDAIAKCAFHEVCELLLVDLSANLEAFLDKDYVEKMRHEVIRRLENFVFS